MMPSNSGLGFTFRIGNKYKLLSQFPLKNGITKFLTIHFESYMTDKMYDDLGFNHLILWSTGNYNVCGKNLRFTTNKALY